MRDSNWTGGITDCSARGDFLGQGGLNAAGGGWVAGDNGDGSGLRDSIRIGLTHYSDGEGAGGEN